MEQLSLIDFKISIYIVVNIKIVSIQKIVLTQISLLINIIKKN